MCDPFDYDFSKEIWADNTKYEEETCVEESFKRVAVAIASVEKEDLREKWGKIFASALIDRQFCPAGRILANAGTKYSGTTLFNCSTSPLIKYDADSLDGIMETLRIQSQTLKSESGWGHNFSWIRPRGSLIKGIGVESPGAVKYMELFNKSSEIITSGSGKDGKKKGQKKKIRKGAQIAFVDCWHPDVEEFITAKRVANRLDKFNVSVGCYDDFMEAVDRVETTGHDEEWNLIFPDTNFHAYKEEWNGNIYLWKSKGYPVIVHKTVSVKYLWDLIMRSTYDYNDPGIFYFDVANRTHLLNYVSAYHINSCNPCGEQSMPPGSVCDLASIILPRFFVNRRFDYELLKDAVGTAVRFLDNVNDYSAPPHESYTNSIKSKRRIGLGLMGWGSLLYLLKIRFGSDEAELIKDKIMSVFVYATVEASINLAIEKGPFIECDKKKLADHLFWDQVKLPPRLRDLIRQHGIRNSSLFSIQPTGNTGIFCGNVSGGCEPIFLPTYTRTVIVQSAPDYLIDRLPKYWQGEYHETNLFKWTKEGKEDILRGVDEFGIIWKIDKNRGLVKEVICEDLAVRILKESGEWDEKTDWAVTTETISVDEHVKDLKGFAKWIDASISKTVNLPNNYSYEDFKKLYLDAHRSKVIKGITSYRAGTMATVLSAVGAKASDTKRPKKLPAHLHNITVKGKKFYVAVGIHNDHPWEVFAFLVESAIDHKDGFIQRVNKGKYTLIADNELLIENLSDLCEDSEGALSRMTSVALQNNVPISEIVSQLEKVKGDITMFSKALARTLKKYIPDGITTDEKCPECDKTLYRTEGCLSCLCGFSKCG